MSTPSAPHDPTRISAQPALKTSSGRSWLISGGLITLVSVIVLGFLIALDPLTAISSIVFCVLAYVAMVVVRFAVPPGRGRLWTLAVLLVLIAGTVLTALAIIAAAQWEPLGP